MRIAAAIMLPLVILAGLQLYTLVNSQKARLEETAMSRAGEVMRLVDSQVVSEIRLARALSTSSALKAGDMPRAYQRAQEFQRTAATWRTVRLVDDDHHLEVFDLRRALGPPRPIEGAGHEIDGQDVGEVRVGGIERDLRGEFAIPLDVAVTGPEGAHYRLIVEVDPDSIHRTAAKRFPDTLVSAVVDRKGRFISRTIDYAARLGSPASSYLRAAVARGGSGDYSGRTLEGQPNYTYFTTSPLTGWSTHVAISASPVQSAQQASFAIWGFVVAACLTLGGLMIWLTLRDLAQSRIEDERLRQAQKMEALGQLTGGVAHDFNNLLTAIIGGLDLVSRRMSADDRNRRYVEAALEAGQRGAKLTARLLAFSRTQPLGLEAVDLASVLEGMQNLLHQSLGPTITLTLEIAPDTPWVLTDRNQLELAVLNLAVNARDAMPDGGRLTVGARAAAPSNAQYDRARHAELTVSDTGSGMTASVAARAFDPFFTTKEVSKGTGLGLAQVYGLAKQSGGDVRIETELGAGTTIILDLPATPRPQSDRDDDKATLTARQAPSGCRILVLDDDPSVRGVVVETLRARGHVVFEAATGEDALAVLETIDPDLFILDFLMPGLDGAEVARRSRAIRPHQKMMIISGHFDQAAFGDLATGLPILRKPFDGATLAKVVSELLDLPSP